MTIDEAIRLLEELHGDIVRFGTPTNRKSIKLGIEALKELRKLRNSGILGAWKLLPGETEE